MKNHTPGGRVKIVFKSILNGSIIWLIGTAKTALYYFLMAACGGITGTAALFLCREYDGLAMPLNTGIGITTGFITCFLIDPFLRKRLMAEDLQPSSDTASK